MGIEKELLLKRKWRGKEAEEGSGVNKIKVQDILEKNAVLTQPNTWYTNYDLMKCLFFSSTERKKRQREKVHVPVTMSDRNALCNINKHS